MAGFSCWDWMILAAYLVGIIWIGIWAAGRIKDTTDYFMGGRRFGKTLMIFFTFGAGTHSDQAVSVASKTYTDGLSGIWYQWFWLFNTPFYWLFPPLFRRMRALTTADYFELRYSLSVAALFAFMGILQFVVNLATMLKGCGAMISAVSFGALNETVSISVVTVLFVIYGIAGGLRAAVLTDFIQGILTIVLSFLVLPFALNAVGGISGLKETIQNPTMFSLVVPGGIGVFYITMITINGLVGIVTQPHVIATCAAGRTEIENRVGFCYGNMLKRICTIAWTLTGLCAVALYPGLTGDQIDQTYGLMARDLLPVVMPGLVGLFIASLLATVMSSCDAWMISCSALFTENIYRPFLAPNQSQKHYLVVGRIASGAIVVLGILYALSMETVIHGLETFWKIQAMMGIAFWVGLFWRRATATAAWYSTVVAFLVMLVTLYLPPEYVPAFMLYDGALYLPYQMLAYLTAGFVAMIVVSLITRPVESSKLERLYRALHTPVQEGEHPLKPFEVPEHSKPEVIRKIINHPDFEVPVPGRVAVVGFLVTCLLVGLLIGSVYWIASL